MKFDTLIEHDLSDKEATKRIKDALNKHDSKASDLNYNWEGNKCTLSSKSKKGLVYGTLLVKHLEVRISGDFPPMAESMLKEKLKTILA